LLKIPLAFPRYGLHTLPFEKGEVN